MEPEDLPEQEQSPDLRRNSFIEFECEEETRARKRRISSESGDVATAESRNSDESTEFGNGGYPTTELETTGLGRTETGFRTAWATGD